MTEIVRRRMRETREVTVPSEDGDRRVPLGLVLDLLRDAGVLRRAALGPVLPGAPAAAVAAPIRPFLTEHLTGDRTSSR